MLQKILFSVLFVLLTLPAQAAPLVIPPPPTIDATAYILLDYNSGRVLAQSNPDMRIEPASLTKIMSSYVVESELAQGRIKATDMVRISEKAWRMEGSRMFVEVGDMVAVQDLLKGVIIQSGNDSTVSLAEHIAGSEETFASMMNTHAQRLGMKNTHFVNATGLPDPAHYTTARDLAVLSRALIRDFPVSYKLYSQKEFVFNNIRQPNRNLLLYRDPTVDGIKTGHTSSAGYCLVSSAVRDGMRLISVVLGTKSDNARAEESRKLLTYGARFYEARKIYDANVKVTTARVWKGDVTDLPLGVTQPLAITLPRGQQASVKVSFVLNPKIIAPVRKGQVLGKVNVLDGNKVLAQAPLVALQDDPEGGFFRRLIDMILMFFA